MDRGIEDRGMRKKGPPSGGEGVGCAYVHTGFVGKRIPRAGMHALPE